MKKVVCLVNVATLLVGLLGGSVLKVHLSGVVTKKVRFQVLDCKLCMEDIFLFQVPVNCSYLVKLFPR